MSGSRGAPPTGGEKISRGQRAAPLRPGALRRDTPSNRLNRRGGFATVPESSVLQGERTMSGFLGIVIFLILIGAVLFAWKMNDSR